MNNEHLCVMAGIFKRFAAIAIFFTLLGIILFVSVGSPQKTISCHRVKNGVKPRYSGLLRELATLDYGETKEINKLQT